MLSLEEVQRAIVEDDRDRISAEATVLAAQRGLVWVILPLSDGRWATTYNAEIDPGYVFTWKSQETAITTIRRVWESIHPDYTDADRTNRFGWFVSSDGSVLPESHAISVGQTFQR